MLSLESIATIVKLIPATAYNETKATVLLPRIADLRVVKDKCMHTWTWLLPWAVIEISVESIGDSIPEGDQELIYFDRKTLKVLVNGDQIPLRASFGSKSQFPVSFHANSAVTVAGLDMALRAS